MVQPGTSLAPWVRALRARRRALGLRQADLADLAGCSERFVQALEGGKAALRLDKLMDVLRVLGFDLALVPGSGIVQDPALPTGGE